MPDTSYHFLDCGDGRRLERLGGVTVSRPAPAAAGPPVLPRDVWRRAELSFTREDGWRGDAPDEWRVAFAGTVLALRPAAAGQIGVFPEHAAVASRLLALLDARPVPAGGFRILNLFAHTGLVTLRLAERSDVAVVAHVDAAPAAVRQARANAAVSGLEQAPIRWLVDDAPAFCGREVRRGDGYDLLVADPPAFGRKKGGREWKLKRDLPGLLKTAEMLLSKRGGVLCLTCHSGGWKGRELAERVGRALPDASRPETLELTLTPEGKGNALFAGTAVFAVIPRRSA